MPKPRDVKYKSFFGLVTSRACGSDMYENWNDTGPNHDGQICQSGDKSGNWCKQRRRFFTDPREPKIWTAKLVFKWPTSYHFKAWEFRNLRAFEFFQLLMKLFFKPILELRI